MNTKPNIFFSILVPCYNYAFYLGQCLQSVIAQTIGDWEAIVVDDASTIGDAETVVKQFNDPRIRFYKHPVNRGAGATFNTAFNLSQYPFVTLLSADDTLDCNYLACIRSVLSEKPETDIVIVDLQLFGDVSSVWHYKICDTKALTLNQWIPGGATMMKRSVWESAGGHYEGPELKGGNLDWDFWLSAFRSHWVVTHIPQALYLYRVHHTSITSKRPNEDYRIHEFLAERHKELFQLYDTYNQFKAIGYMNSAEAFAKTNQYLRAIQFAREAWLLFPQEIDVFTSIKQDFTDNHNDIAALRKELEAKIAFSSDFGLSPSKENVFAYRDLARLAAAQEDWSAAEVFLLHALAFMKNPVTAANLCNLLGLVYMKKKQLDLAEQAFSLTSCFDPQNRGVFLHRATLLLAQGQWQQAFKTAVEGLRIVPGNRSLLSFLGKLTTLYQGPGWQNELQILETLPIAQSQPTTQPSTEDVSRSFLYHSSLGQKIYWISRAKDLFDKYGQSSGGYETLQSVIERVAPLRILEIGCGNGRNFPLYHMMNIAEVIGQDISTAALELARKRQFPHIQLTDTPITQLDFPASYFDLTISNRVLQHIPIDSIEPVIQTICQLSRFIYINEATREEVGDAFDSFYMFLHDYPRLFAKFHFSLIHEMRADNQRRFLFAASI